MEGRPHEIPVEYHPTPPLSGAGPMMPLVLQDDTNQLYRLE